MRPLLCLLLLTGALAGCLRSTSHTCADVSDCSSAGAVCEQASDGEKHCAHPDPDCHGYRFDDNAGEAAGECLAAAVDAGVDAIDASPDAALPAGRSANVCLEGTRFPDDFSPCVAAVCDRLPTCCTSGWSELCVQTVEHEPACGPSCSSVIAYAGFHWNVDTSVIDSNALEIWGPDAAHANTWKPLDVAAAVAAAPYSSVTFADLDADGQPELIATNGNPYTGSQGNLQRVLEWTGAALEARVSLDALPQLTNVPAFQVSVGDHDGDGQVDLAIGGNLDVTLLRNFGPDQYTYVASAGAPPRDPVIEWLVTSVADADVDNDGKAEVAVADYRGHVALIDLDGSNAVVTQMIDVPGVCRNLAWGDANGDGDLELAVTGYGYVQVYDLVAGQLVPTPITDYAGAGQDFTDVEWIYADGDRFLDLAAVEKNGPLHLFRGSATGIAQAPVFATPSTDNDAKWKLAAGDVDGDGDINLAAASETAHVIYLNQTVGTAFNFVRQWSEPSATPLFAVNLTVAP